MANAPREESCRARRDVGLGAFTEVAKVAGDSTKERRESIMSRTRLAATLAMSLLSLVPRANAQGWYSPGGYGGYYRQSPASENHANHHDDLDHRAYHRGVEHREAHRYPMTWGQHESLHDNLNHEAYHDRLEHRSAHRSGAYYPRGGCGGHDRYDDGGIGLSGRGYSLWFGW